MLCRKPTESLQLTVKIVAMLNFVFWSLLLILYGFSFFEAVKTGGTLNSTGADSFMGDMLHYGERNYKDENDEVMFSAVLLMNFVVIIIFQLFLSVLLLHAAEKQSVVQTQVWFYVSSLIFGIDIVSHVVAFVMSGAHVFILSKTILLVYFAFCLYIVYSYIQELQANNQGQGSLGQRAGCISPPILIVAPVSSQSNPIQDGIDYHSTSPQLVASFPFPPDTKSG